MIISSKINYEMTFTRNIKYLHMHLHNNSYIILSNVLHQTCYNSMDESFHYQFDHNIKCEMIIKKAILKMAFLC